MELENRDEVKFWLLITLLPAAIACIAIAILLLLFHPYFKKVFRCCGWIKVKHDPSGSRIDQIQSPNTISSSISSPSDDHEYAVQIQIHTPTPLPITSSVHHYPESQIQDARERELKTVVDTDSVENPEEEPALGESPDLHWAFRRGYLSDSSHSHKATSNNNNNNSVTYENEREILEACNRVCFQNYEKNITEEEDDSQTVVDKGAINPGTESRPTYADVAKKPRISSPRKNELPKPLVPIPTVSNDKHTPIRKPTRWAGKKGQKNTGIILAVDATPKTSGGYCISKEFCWYEFYSIGNDQLPWRLRNLSRRGNSAEFEMKNLIFALFNWEEEIRGSGKLWVYTDNMAIKNKGIGHAYGRMVRQYLYHLHNCHQVRIMNYNNYHVHRHKNPETFRKYIEPADYLSRIMLDEFHNHMEHYFPRVTYQAVEESTTKVEQLIDGWIKRKCSTCGFRIRETDSLRETIKKRAKL